MSKLEYQTRLAETHCPHPCPLPRSFSFRITPEASRRIYLTNLDQDSDCSDDHIVHSLNYSRSIAYNRTFNNTIMSLCLLPEDKEKSEGYESTSASTSGKIKRLTFTHKS